METSICQQKKKYINSHIYNTKSLKRPFSISTLSRDLKCLQTIDLKAALVSTSHSRFQVSIMITYLFLQVFVAVSQSFNWYK